MHTLKNYMSHSTIAASTSTMYYIFRCYWTGVNWFWFFMGTTVNKLRIRAYKTLSSPANLLQKGCHPASEKAYTVILVIHQNWPLDLFVNFKENVDRIVLPQTEAVWINSYVMDIFSSQMICWNDLMKIWWSFVLISDKPKQT